MPRPEVLYLHEMLRACVRIIEIVGQQSTVEVSSDRNASEALLWNFTVLGEAAGRVPEEFRAEHPEVPWRRPSDLRNRIVHGYWSIDLDILVTTAKADLPSLRRQLEALLGDA